MSELILAPADEEEPLAPEQPEGEATTPVFPLDERAAVEWPFRVEPVYVTTLLVDHSYQRPVEERFVTTGADDFEESLVGVIDVAERTPGVYAILDGQQRWEICKRVGKTTMMAAKYHGLTVQDEAGFFYRKNKDRKAMQGFYGFRARMLFGDEEAVYINEAVEAQGFRLGPRTDHAEIIASIAAVERAWTFSSNHRVECLTPSLVTIRENFRGRERSLDASMLVGFGKFWQAYADEEVDQMVLKPTLEEVISPKNLMGLARDRIREGASGTGLAAGVSLAVVDAYNRRARAQGRERLDPERLS